MSAVVHARHDCSERLGHDFLILKKTWSIAHRMYIERNLCGAPGILPAIMIGKNRKGKWQDDA